jgi:RNA polymerase sigma factor (sigma-70 family)
MSAPGLNARLADADLWKLVCQGSAEAFEVLVRRHQSLVSAVAYNACGNLALSEDVAQETFWAAWRERASLAQPERLRPWLCGIARNLAKNARRRAARPAESAAALDVVSEETLATDDVGPSEEAITHEEEALVWRELEAIPDAYREALILFYREDQSVADVAAALGLGEDAVKQRLSRGRAMLRERVAAMVEGGLRRSRPGRKFTVAVMTGITAGSAAAKTATAGVVGAVAKTAAGAGLGAGALGGLAGTLFGLAGGWLGTWVPAQLAPTKRERDYLIRAGRRMLLVSVVFMVALYGVIAAFAGRPIYLFAWACWMVSFMAYVGVESVRLARAVNRIRTETGPEAEPNDSVLRTRLSAMASTFRGRVYRSSATFLGLPLLDINVADPLSAFDKALSGDAKTGRPVACGWIAIGDDARGLLLAIGSIARGFVAVGGRAIGVVSFGGLTIGLVTLGGFSLGGIAVGGGAIGWWAWGGGAIAWDSAFGGLAIADRVAFGGAALANQYAVGGGGGAAHFNDAAARALVLGHPFHTLTQWFDAYWGWFLAGCLLLPELLVGLLLLVMYRRDIKR